MHAQAKRPEDTDWKEITGLYTVLWHLQPTVIVALNRAVAIAMRDGPVTGLGLLANLADQHQFNKYLPFHAARADLLKRAGQSREAEFAYQQAIELAGETPEGAYLQKQLRTLQ